MQPPLVLRRYEAASVGVSRHALESIDWQHVSHGLYAAPGTVEYLPQHCAALLRVLPASSAFSHVTGAAIRGWPLPWLPPYLPVFACCPAAGTHVQRAGAYVSRLASRPVDEVQGLPVLSTPVLLLDLARDLQLVDLTAVVDGAFRLEGVEAETVLKALPARAHGGPRLRRALAYCDPKAESRRETALRLLHTLAGISQLESQVKVGGANGPLGRADLWLVGTRRLVEYDGAEHRRKQRHRRDLVRDRKLHRTHWERYGYSDDDLIRTPGEILRDAEEALGLGHDPRRLERWLAHARRSTLTPSGRRRLEHRLSRYVAAAARPTPD